MIKIRLFVSPICPKCPSAKTLASELQKSRRDIQIETLDVSAEENYLAALMLQIASTPTFVIGDTPIYRGTVPTIQEFNEKIDEYKQKYGN